MRNWIDLIEKQAFHGTPWDFDKFGLSKTEGGANVYGWGLYFASKIAVARVYQNNLQVLEANNRFVKFVTDQNYTIYKALDMLLDNKPKDEILRTIEGSPMVKKLSLLAAQFLKKFSHGGKIMTVELPDNGYLIWGKELKDQDRDVKPIVDYFVKKYGFNVSGRVTGSDFYHMMKDQLGGMRNASLELASQSMVGIRVLRPHDSGTGAGGEYHVVFKPEMLHILSKSE